MTWLRMCDKKKIKTNEPLYQLSSNEYTLSKKKFGLSLVKLLFESLLQPKNVVEGKSNHQIIFCKYSHGHD